MSRTTAHPRRPVRFIAVSGGVGCGKSEVLRRLAKHGIPVFDADDAARDLLRLSHPVGRRVVRAFGREMLNEQGEIDRVRLAHLVFRDPAARRRLEHLMHPAILRACRRWKAAQSGPVAAAGLPLLHELGLEREWTETWCVVASRETALRRLRKRGWSRAESLRRMRAQWPVRAKAARSTLVIRNDGSLRNLERTIQTALGLNRGRTRA